MPKPVIQQITAWSFSRYQTWKGCPRKAKYKFIDKLPEPSGKAAERGSAIDKMAEVFAKPAAKGVPCPPELASFEEEFRELQKVRAVTQEQWSFTKEWKETGWFDPDAWCRAKTDIYVLSKRDNILTLVDVKTGKIRDEHAEQLELYGLTGLLKYPKCAGVDVRLWYLDQGIEHPEEEKIYLREELPALKKVWELKVAPMLADTRFGPKPSRACAYCHFRKENGGPCEF